jgi:hypothetical protein
LRAKAEAADVSGRPNVHSVGVAVLIVADFGVDSGRSVGLQIALGTHSDQAVQRGSAGSSDHVSP